MVTPLSEPTPRELNILLAVADGQTEHAIGLDLGISPKTVSSHKVHVYRKLNLSSAWDVIEWSILYFNGPEMPRKVFRRACRCRYLSPLDCHRSGVIRGKNKGWDLACDCRCHL